jgi:hypothetical protein
VRVGERGNGINRGDANVLNLPSDKYPRRASDGCASIGFRMSDRDTESNISAVPSTSTIKAYQECQDLQVNIDVFFSYQLSAHVYLF